MKKESGNRNPEKRIGVVINMGLKPSRDVLGNVVHYVLTENLGKPLLFQASGGTLPENIKLFASNKLDGMIVCGLRREMVVEFLRLMPNHPPIVVCTYYPLSEKDMNQLGNGGELVLDNEGIGRRASRKQSRSPKRQGRRSCSRHNQTRLQDCSWASPPTGNESARSAHQRGSRGSPRSLKPPYRQTATQATSARRSALQTPQTRRMRQQPGAVLSRLLLHALPRAALRVFGMVPHGKECTISPPRRQRLFRV